MHSQKVRHASNPLDSFVLVQGQHCQAESPPFDACLKNILTVGVTVSNPDEAVDFYVNKLGFEKHRDISMGEGMRWIEVAPPGAQTALVLAKGYGPDQDRIGKFT